VRSATPSRPAPGEVSGSRCRIDAAARFVAGDETVQFERATAAQCAGFVAHRLANDSTPASARQAIEGRTAELWARRGSHADGFSVSVGLGTADWAPELADGAATRNSLGDLGDVSQLSDLPLTADIGEVVPPAVRLVGSSQGVARSILMQLAPTADRPTCAWWS
jgi:hypothetical protein